MLSLENVLLFLGDGGVEGRRDEEEEKAEERSERFSWVLLTWVWVGLPYSSG